MAKLSNGKKIIIAGTIFSALVLAAMFWMADFADRQNKNLRRDVLISEASGILGVDMKVLVPRKDINADTEAEIVAAVPGGQRWVFNDDSTDVWVKQLLVLQMNGKQRREMLYATPGVIMIDERVEQGEKDSEEPMAPQGYRVQIKENRKTKFVDFKIALAGAGGEPRSDVLFFSWNPKEQAYQLPQLP